MSKKIHQTHKHKLKKLLGLVCERKVSIGWAYKSAIEVLIKFFIIIEFKLRNTSKP